MVRRSDSITRSKTLAFYTILVGGVVLGTLVVGEAALRIFHPVEYLYPRYKYSPKYGFVLFEDRTMVHGLPGKFEFRYTINEFGYRGRSVSPSSRGDRHNVIVLGDSYSFGMGVQDGEEFPWLLQDELGTKYNVVNLANPGWGLTQHIRRYYDFGSLYLPRVVVLQFCSNDPEDNFDNMVTTLDGGEFRFLDRAGGINWLKKYLSDSRIQQSQLYNFFRSRGYLLIQTLLRKRAEADYEEEQAPAGPAPVEDFYNALLEKFAGELGKSDVALIVISVNGQLDRYPAIKERVFELNRRGTLHYVDVVPWFKGVENYDSPEGHLWGAKAHRVIAENLAVEIRTLGN